MSNLQCILFVLLLTDTLKLVRNKNNEIWKHMFIGPKGINRVKRDKRSKYRNKYLRNLYHHDEIILNYEELLKFLATDFKKIKLNAKFHCSHYSASTTAGTKTITTIIFFCILYIY